MRQTAILLILIALPAMADPLQLNSAAFDTSKFNVTTYASSLSAPLSTLRLPDGSLAITTYSEGIVRFNGIGSTGTTIYSSPGVQLGLVQAGDFYIDSNWGQFANPATPVITVLKPGATAADPLTAVGSLQLSFPLNWEHNQPGIAVRAAPGQPGSYDVVFNVGSEGDHELSADKVQLSGLATGTLDGDSLYAVTLDLSGPLAAASNLRKVATGIRNVVGMGFQPGTGDFYFADNAIDGPGADGDEPPQAEELNRIAGNVLGIGSPIDFGYPDCYIQYRTGAQVGSGCTLPFFAIQPLPNGTMLGSESEGAAQLAFAPADFPAGFNNGIFIGFSGKGAVTGPANEENAVGYYSFDDGSFIHFSENSQNGVYQPIGISATADSLFISDFGSGTVYQVTSAAPEPSTFALFTLAALSIAVLMCRRASAAKGR